MRPTSGAQGRPRLPARHAHPAQCEARWLTEEGVGAGLGVANVELSAIPRLAGRNSVELPATPPNSAHLRPPKGQTRHSCAPTNRPLLGDPTRVVRRRIGVRRTYRTSRETGSPVRVFAVWEAA
jgi:hypothetical protein